MSQRTEYQVSEIDEYGDIMDCDVYDTKSEALKAAERCDQWDGVVVEKVTRYYPLGEGVSKFVTIYTAGNPDALKAGGWIE